MSQRPNILLITTDQQHPDTIGALGNEQIKTPHLDSLVKDGVSFKKAYVTNPVCSPSRSTILTGKYPSKHGCWNIGTRLDESVPTISNILTKNGYNTSLFGKAHFQPVMTKGTFESSPNIFDRKFWKEFNGPYYGFEKVSMVHGHADEFSSQGMNYGAWLEEQGVDPDKYFGPAGGYREGVWDLPEEYHYTRWTADNTISHIEKLSEKHDDSAPFFTWCSFQDPHNWYLAPEPWASMYDPDDLPEPKRKVGEMYDKTSIHRCAIKGDWSEIGGIVTEDPTDPSKGLQCLGWSTDNIGDEKAKQWRATYYGMISHIDHHIGRVLNALERCNLADNTIVIFSTDHGDYIGNHGLWLKGPLHYDDVVRVPFIVRWPSQIPQNKQTDSLISLVDIAPTILDVCGIEDKFDMQGVSQFKTWKNPSSNQRDWCLIENRAEESIYIKTLVDNRYKLNYHVSRDEGELYDLKSDPNEFVNLYYHHQYHHILVEMLGKLIDAVTEIKNPLASKKISSENWDFEEKKLDDKHTLNLIANDYKIEYCVSGNNGKLYHIKNDPDEMNNLYLDIEYNEILIEMLSMIIDATTQTEGPYSRRTSFA